MDFEKFFREIFGRHDRHDRETAEILFNQRRIMGQLDTLNAAIAALSTEEDSVLAVLGSVTTELATLEADFIAAQGAGVPVDLSASLATIASMQAKLDTISASATAADTSLKAAIPAAKTGL